MNYLVHLYLSDDDPYCRLGNLMGDFVKGPLAQYDYPDRLLEGVRQHRTVDTLAQGHAAVRRSKARLDDRFGHTKGILIDIFYDHYLSRNWEKWGLGSLRAFAEAGYRLLNRHRDILPEAFQPVARRIIRYDWLRAYRHPDTIRFVLERMSGRLTRPNLLAQGYMELHRCGRGLEVDCHDFLRSAAAILGESTGEPVPWQSITGLR
jgi:acyl carrier protein phosphodiesterase